MQEASPRTGTSGRSGTRAAGSTTRTRSTADGPARSGGRLHLLHVPRHDLHGFAELLGRAELDHLGAGVQDGRVPRTDVVGVARLELLLAAARAEADLPADHVAHVLALALVVREPPEERREVRVL